METNIVYLRGDYTVTMELRWIRPHGIRPVQEAIYSVQHNGKTVLRTDELRIAIDYISSKLG